MECETINLLITAGVGLLSTAIGAGAGLLGGRLEFRRQVKRQEIIKKQERHDAMMVQARDACLNYINTIKEYNSALSNYLAAGIKYLSNGEYNFVESQAKEEEKKYNLALSHVINDGISARLLCPPAEKYFKKIAYVAQNTYKVISISKTKAVPRKDIDSTANELHNVLIDFQKFLSEFFKDYLLSFPTTPTIPPFLP